MSAPWQFCLLFLLTAIFLPAAFSKRVYFGWGRRGKVLMSPSQQRLFGSVLGFGFLTLSLLAALRWKSSSIINDFTWSHAAEAIISGAMSITWAEALLDPRFRPKTTGGKFGAVVNILIVALCALFSVVSFSTLFRYRS